MKDQIKELIKSSHVIKDSEKALYSKLVDFIDEEKQKKLLTILENELKTALIIENQSVEEKLAVNRDFIDKIDNFFKKEEEKAIRSEEKEEHDQGENILNKLNEA